MFIYAIETLNTKTVDKKLDVVLRSLNWATKVYLACGFVLRNLEGEKSRCFYAHETKTLNNWQKLLCTGVDMAKPKEFLSKTVLTWLCIREKVNTKGIFYHLTDLTVLAALLKVFSVVCREAVLPEPRFNKLNGSLLLNWQKYKATIYNKPMSF